MFFVLANILANRMNALSRIFLFDLLEEMKEDDFEGENEKQRNLKEVRSRMSVPLSCFFGIKKRFLE